MQNFVFLPPKVTKKYHRDPQEAMTIKFNNRVPQIQKQHEIDNEYYETTQSECEIIKLNEDPHPQTEYVNNIKASSNHNNVSDEQQNTKRNSSSSSLNLSRFNSQFDVLKQQNASFRSYYAQVKQRLKSSTNNSLSRSDSSQIHNMKSQNDIKNKMLTQSQIQAAIDIKEVTTRIIRKQYKLFFNQYKDFQKEHEIIQLFSAWQTQISQQLNQDQDQYSQHQDFDDINQRKLSLDMVTERSTKRFSQNPLYSDQSAATLHHQKSVPQGMIIQSNSQNHLQSFNQNHQMMCQQDTFRHNQMQQQQQFMCQLPTMDAIHQNYMTQYPTQQFQNFVGSPQQNAQYLRNQVQTPQLANHEIYNTSLQSSGTQERDISSQLTSRLVEKLAKEIKREVIKSISNNRLVGNTSRQQRKVKDYKHANCNQQSLQESFLTDENSLLDSNYTIQKSRVCNCQSHNKKQKLNSIKLQEIQNIINNHQKCKDCNQSKITTTSNNQELSPRLVDKIKSLLPPPPPKKQNEVNLKKSACIQTEQEQQIQIVSSLNSYYQNNHSKKSSVISQERQNLLHLQQNNFIKSIQSSQNNQILHQQTNNQDQFVVQRENKVKQKGYLETTGTATFRDQRQESSRDYEQYQLYKPAIDKYQTLTHRNNEVKQQNKMDCQTSTYNEETQRSIFSQNRGSKKNQEITDNSRYNKVYQSNNMMLVSQDQFLQSIRNEDNYLDATTKAQKDVSNIDPAGDLSLVMYNTGTKNDFQKYDELNDRSSEVIKENSKHKDEQLKTLSMFETGFKTFFPQNQQCENEGQYIQEQQKKQAEYLNNHQQQDLSYFGVASAVSRYFNDECDDISEIRGGGFNGYQSQLPIAIKRGSIQEELYFQDQFSPTSNNTEKVKNNKQDNNRVMPNYIGIQKKILNKKPQIRNDECSFEYSKADDMPTHLLNESSFDQLMIDMDNNKEQQREQQENKVFIPKLALDKIEQIKRDKAKEALKEMVFNSINY